MLSGRAGYIKYGYSFQNHYRQLSQLQEVFHTKNLAVDNDMLTLN